MPGLVRSVSHGLHPLDELRAALAWAREKGIPVRLSANFGVVCTSGEASGLATWERDPRMPEGPNVVGIAILRSQPQCTSDDDAAMLAVGAPLAFVEGVCDGVARQETSHAWTEGVGRRQYLAGVEAGLMVRAWVKRPRPAAPAPSGSLVS